MTSVGTASAAFAFLLLAAIAAPAQSVVPTRAIRSQAVISASDVALIPGDHPGAFTRIDDVVGLEARVSLYPGRPVLIEEAGAPALLDRNQIVTMIYDIGGLRITAVGRALDRAGQGEMVRIMNIESRTTVMGLVRPDGLVEVGRK